MGVSSCVYINTSTGVPVAETPLHVDHMDNKLLPTVINDPEYFQDRSDGQWLMDPDSEQQSNDLNLDTISSILQEAILGVIGYITFRWNLHQGQHHRDHLSEAVVQAEMYHQLRNREETHNDVKMVTVETPLLQIANSKGQPGYADIVAWIDYTQVHIEIKTVFPIVPRSTYKKPVTPTILMAITDDIQRLAAQKHLGYFLLMGKDELVDQVMQKVIYFKHLHKQHNVYSLDCVVTRAIPPFYIAGMVSHNASLSDENSNHPDHIVMKVGVSIVHQYQENHLMSILFRICAWTAKGNLV